VTRIELGTLIGGAMSKTAAVATEVSVLSVIGIFA
jgi:hypothetical protein